jgi:hypothetical protein
MRAILRSADAPILGGHFGNRLGGRTATSENYSKVWRKNRTQFLTHLAKKVDNVI